MSFEKSIFPDDLKIAEVTPVLKAGNNKELSNYRPISVLPCFSKILERVMYNRLYNNTYSIQTFSVKIPFGFQERYSTDHAILQLVDQLHNNFEQNNFTLGVSIDLSIAFNTVYHNIVLKKLEINGIAGKNLKWIKNYLNNRKQYIQIYNEEKTNLLLAKYGVPQGSILGPLLFLIYNNDLQFVSDVLDPIMFADDTNLFYSHKDINALFLKVNNERHKINQWFISNKPSLNIKKTKYSFFHKRSKQDDIPFILPKLKINNYEIKRAESIEFLGALLDENLTWKPHIKYIENNKKNCKKYWIII